MFMPMCSADSLIIWVNALIIWVNALYDSQSAAGPASDKSSWDQQNDFFSTETYAPLSREFP